MANSLIITLDTQPPIIGIVSNDVLNKNIPAIVTVRATKTISTNCSVYLIDDTGKKFNAQLDFQDTVVTGTLNLDKASTGKAVIFATVQDTSQNMSKTARRIVTLTDVVMNGIEQMSITIQAVGMQFDVEVVSSE